jgi:Uma2 family endonuclease
MISMRALLLDARSFLEERERLGQDIRDEVWDGVLHVVPSPSSFHQSFGFELCVALKSIADERGWFIQPETTLYEPGKRKKNYRVPDVTLVAPKHRMQAGTEGRAELVVEILSPRDESRLKLPFYARCKVQEVWLIHRDPRIVEVHVLRRDGYHVTSTKDGTVTSRVLDIELQTLPGPKLRVGRARL